MSRLHDLEIPLTITNLQQQYKKGILSPRDVVEVIIAELKTRGDNSIPTTREIISKAGKLTAVQAFERLYAVKALKRESQPL